MQRPVYRAPDAPPVLRGYAPVDPYGSLRSRITEACRQAHTDAEPVPASIAAAQDLAAEFLADVAALQRAPE